MPARIVWPPFIATGRMQAVCLVSAESPQLLVYVNKTASAHDPIGEAGVFCVNILCLDHRKLPDLAHFHVGSLSISGPRAR